MSPSLPLFFIKPKLTPSYHINLYSSIPFSYLTSCYHIAIVKISQLGHSAVFCLGGIALQLSWIAYLGPITPTRCMVRPWLLGAHPC